MSVLEVPIGDLKAADDNIRNDVGDVAELAASIKAGGVLQPLLVNEDDLVVVVGARRLAAAKKAGLKTVPVVKRTFTEQERVEAMIVENLQREDLTPLEEAAAYQRLADLGLTQREIAGRVGRSQATVAKRISLLALPEKVRKQVDEGKVTLPDAAELAKIKDDPKLVEQLAKKGTQTAGYGQSISSRVESEMAKRTKQRKRKAAGDALRKNGETVLDVPVDEYGYRVELPDGVKEVRKEAHTAEFIEMDPKAHAKLDCHAVVIDPREFKPVEVCTKPETHPSKADKIKAERQKRAEEQRKADEEFRQMTERRREFVADQVAARLDKEALLELAWLALTNDRHYAYGSADEYEIACDLLRVDKPGDDVAGPGEIEWDVVLENEAAKSVSARQRATLAIAAAKFEIKLEREGNWSSQIPWFEWLAQRGYELSTQEKHLTDWPAS